mmetsp:Transcript_26255/g.41519  ORF Transcript_26255/g.41519 Transcript_26255/m.41519 type:complete len:112 (-) Transcript_26255:323-658(-)
MINNNILNESKPQKRYRPGILTFIEIRKYQRSTFLIMKKIPFFRIVKLITSKYCRKKKIRWNANAIFILQEATECYLINLLSNSNLCAMHSNRITVKPNDLKLAKKINNLL